MRHLPRRRALARLPHRVLESLAEWRLARQLRHSFNLDAAIRATHTEDLHHHGRPEFHAGQVTHFPFADVVRVLQLAPASGTHQLSVSPLPPYPELKRLGPLVDLVPVAAVPRPTEQFRQFAVSQTAECTEISPIVKT